MYRKAILHETATAATYHNLGALCAEAGQTDEAIEHWISAFPESKCPPVYLPSNSQWSRRKAMFMRTGHLLQYAHWKLKQKKK